MFWKKVHEPDQFSDGVLNHCGLPRIRFQYFAGEDSFLNFGLLVCARTKFVLVFAGILIMLGCGGRVDAGLAQSKALVTGNRQALPLAPPAISGGSLAASSLSNNEPPTVSPRPESVTQTTSESSVAGVVTFTPHYVVLDWTRSASPVMGYNVYRSLTKGGPYKKVNLFLEPATAYTDYSVAAGKTYHYVVTAMDAGRESPFSGEAIAVVPTP